MTVWCLVGNGGLDPYSSPYIIPNNSLHNPFPHSLLRTGQMNAWSTAKAMGTMGFMEALYWFNNQVWQKYVSLLLVTTP